MLLIILLIKWTKLYQIFNLLNIWFISRIPWIPCWTYWDTYLHYIVISINVSIHYKCPRVWIFITSGISIKNCICYDITILKCKGIGIFKLILPQWLFEKINSLVKGDTTQKCFFLSWLCPILSSNLFNEHTFHNYSNYTVLISGLT